MRRILMVVLLVLVCVQVASADDWDRKTAFSINQPVRIPGKVVLPAGSYVIKRADPAMDPSLVRITDPTETKVYATLFGIPVELRNLAETTRLIFGESPRGSLEPLSAWYYPGVMGLEFPNTESEQNHSQSSN